MAFGRLSSNYKFVREPFRLAHGIVSAVSFFMYYTIGLQ